MRPFWPHSIRLSRALARYEMAQFRSMTSVFYFFHCFYWFDNHLQFLLTRVPISLLETAWLPIIEMGFCSPDNGMATFHIQPVWISSISISKSIPGSSKTLNTRDEIRVRAHHETTGAIPGQLHQLWPLSLGNWKPRCVSQGWLSANFPSANRFSQGKYLGFDYAGTMSPNYQGNSFCAQIPLHETESDSSPSRYAGRYEPTETTAFWRNLVKEMAWNKSWGLFLVVHLLPPPPPTVAATTEFKPKAQMCFRWGWFSAAGSKANSANLFRGSRQIGAAGAQSESPLGTVESVTHQHHEYFMIFTPALGPLVWDKCEKQHLAIWLSAAGENRPTLQLFWSVCLISTATTEWNSATQSNHTSRRTRTPITVHYCPLFYV